MYFILIRFIGVAVIDTDFERIDFNPCDVGIGNPGPSYLAFTHRCPKHSGVGIPILDPQVLVENRDIATRENFKDPPSPAPPPQKTPKKWKKKFRMVDTTISKLIKTVPPPPKISINLYCYLYVKLKDEQGVLKKTAC